MPLIVKGFYEQRQDIIDKVLSTGVPTQHDLYYVEAIRNEIKYLEHQENLFKTATYETVIRV